MGIDGADQEGVESDLLRAHETDVLVVDEALVEGPN